MSQTTNADARPKKIDALYESVTQQIINHLKEGVPTWVRPWTVSRKNGIGLVPANAITGRPYSGINILILWLARDISGYSGAGWLTYQQCQKAGGRVKKGERATAITFVRFKEKQEEDGTVRKIPQTRAYSVFNTDQCEGLPEDVSGPIGEIPESVAQDALMRCITATGARIEYRGNKAAYLINRDMVVMPPYQTFKDAEGFFGTLSHEVVHWSGAKGRLDRVYGKRFGDEAYSTEELVAELGSAFLCTAHGVPATFRSAQYIASWLKVLENDNRAIFTAASYASQAVTFIRSTEQSDVDELEEELDRLEAAE